jgi:hypothetical protein
MSIQRGYKVVTEEKKEKKALVEEWTERRNKRKKSMNESQKCLAFSRGKASSHTVLQRKPTAPVACKTCRGPDSPTSWRSKEIRTLKKLSSACLEFCVEKTQNSGVDPHGLVSFT